MPNHHYQIPPAIALCIAAIAIAIALLLLPLPWCCRQHCCYGVAAVTVTGVSLPSACPTRAVRRNSNKPPPLVLHTKQKSTKSKTIPLNPCRPLKTSTVKTLWEKHLIVGKTSIFFQLHITHTPFFFPKELHPLLFAKVPHLIFVIVIGLIHHIWILHHGSSME